MNKSEILENAVKEVVKWKDFYEELFNEELEMRELDDDPAYDWEKVWLDNFINSNEWLEYCEYDDDGEPFFNMCNFVEGYYGL